MYGHGTERPFLCPVHGDSRPSASLNIIKQKWYCYTCGARGGLTGEAACIEPDYQEMRDWLDQELREPRVYAESWLNRFTAGPVHPYWLDRVGAEAADRFRLGYSDEDGALTYPLRARDGSVLGVVRRRLLHGDGPKYRYPAGVDVGSLLFNYRPHHRRTVVLCEGALDAISLWLVGVDAFAIYGSRLSPMQVELIDRVDPDVIYTCYDADKAGWQAHCDTERAFRHRLVGRISWPRYWGKDIDDIGLDNRRKVVSDLVSSGETCIESHTCEMSQTETPTSTATSPASRLRIKRTRS